MIGILHTVGFVGQVVEFVRNSLADRMVQVVVFVVEFQRKLLCVAATKPGALDGSKQDADGCVGTVAYHAVEPGQSGL